MLNLINPLVVLFIKIQKARADGKCEMLDGSWANNDQVIITFHPSTDNSQCQNVQFYRFVGNNMEKYCLLKEEMTGGGSNDNARIHKCMAPDSSSTTTTPITDKNRLESIVSSESFVD